MVALVAVVLPIIAVFQVADGVTGIMSGLLRGAGRSVSFAQMSCRILLTHASQATGAAVNVSAYYLIGLPLGFALVRPLSRDE